MNWAKDRCDWYLPCTFTAQVDAADSASDEATKLVKETVLVADTSNLYQVAMPFETQDLDAQSETLYPIAATPGFEEEEDSSEYPSPGLVGDQASLSAQYDFIFSLNRAYHARHLSKLRRFAHGVGVANHLASDQGVLESVQNSGTIGSLTVATAEHPNQLFENFI
jgi:hypothetical protein